MATSYIKGGAVFGRLAELGLVSAYHAHHRLGHGQEQHPTYFHRFKADDAWHIDYCFVSRSLLPQVTQVDVTADESWATRSDHRPLSVTLPLNLHFFMLGIEAWLSSHGEAHAGSWSVIETRRSEQDLRGS